MARPTEREHDVSYMERVIEQGEKLSDFGWRNARVSWRRLHRSLIDAEKRVAELESMLAATPQTAQLTNPHTGTPRDYRDVESDPAGVLIQEPGAPLYAAQKPQAFPSGRGYTVERHGNGWAIYLGRDRQHHGANLGQLTECGPELAAQIQAALNAPQPQAAPQPQDETLTQEALLRTIAQLQAENNFAWAAANRAEAKVQAWETTIVCTGLPMRMHATQGQWGPGANEPIEVPHVTTEKLTSILDRLEKAEAASRKAEPVGEWVMVPREPTEGMLRAASEAQDRGDWIGAYFFKRAWPAMLAAAPVPGVRRG